METVKIGLIGAGTVGCGVIEICSSQKEIIEHRTGIKLEIKAICDRSWEKKKKLLNGIPASDKPEIVLDNPEIDIVIELIGGVNPAKEYVQRALKKGLPVVTANKTLLASVGREIFQLAQISGTEIGFEAAVAGALPIVKTLRRGFIADSVKAIYGILNGTSNFVITKMAEEGMTYKEAIALAQKKGFAETDPSFDINGNDAAQKLAILAGLAFDVFIQEDKIPTEGIADIREIDLRLARSMGWVIRPLAVARKERDGSLLLRVHPAMIHKSHILASVVDEKNAIFIDTSHSGPVMIMGLGAGSRPTAAAVISDIIAIFRNREKRPEIWFRSVERPLKLTENWRYRYYLRFRTRDRPGVLAEISHILASKKISIASMNQQEGPEPVDVVLITHEAEESSLLFALEKIDRLAVIEEPSVYIRIEDHI